MTALSLTKATWNVWQSNGKDCRVLREREGERETAARALSYTSYTLNRQASYGSLQQGKVQPINTSTPYSARNVYAQCSMMNPALVQSWPFFFLSLSLSLCYSETDMLCDGITDWKCLSLGIQWFWSGTTPAEFAWYCWHWTRRSSGSVSVWAWSQEAWAGW